MALGAAFDPKLARLYGEIIAKEAVSLGVNWTFAPVADLNLNPHNPVTNVRSIGDGAAAAIKLLVPHIEGMRANKLAAAAKHFPGDGTDSRNQHIVTSLMTLDVKTWRRQHGKVFKALIDAGVNSIMVGHLGFPDYEAADPKTGLFTPATASRKAMTDLLRGELGFEGVIVTDALTMGGYCSWADYEIRILATFNGGADVFLWPETEKFFDLMERALADGRASKERLDESVRRVLIMQALVGLHEGYPELFAYPEAELKKNRRVAFDVAAKAVTLLRNRKNVLPLKLAPGAEVLLLTAPDHPVVNKKLQCFKELLAKRGFKVRSLLMSRYKEIRQTIAAFDAVFLLCGAKPLYGDPRGDGFAGSALWPFMSNPNIKNRVIISFGTPYFLYEAASADTYVNAYSECPVSQEATCTALFGEIPFTGKSPVRHDYVFERGDGIIASKGK